MRYVSRFNARRLHLQETPDQPTYCGQTSNTGSPFREVRNPGFYAFERTCPECAAEHGRRIDAERAATVTWTEQAPCRWTYTNDYGTYVLEQAGETWLLTWPLSAYERKNGLAPETEEHPTRESASAAVGDM